MPRTRRWLAILCVVVVVAGALLAPVAGGSAPAVLVPLSPLFGFVLLPFFRPRAEPPAYAFFVSPRSPSRAPPAPLSAS
jgi:hypothetical protein